MQCTIILLLFKIAVVVAVSEDGETQPVNDSKGHFLSRGKVKGGSLITTESPLSQQSQ